MGRIRNSLTRRNQQSNTKTELPSWTQLLADYPHTMRDAEFRVNMTIACNDCEYIPKVKDAGKLKDINGKQYQVMHNGILVESGGYFGDWMAKIITKLKGHHEPQEEKLFFEVLKRIPKNSVMIELGSYWSYYSIWFNKAVPAASNYCCEPDPKNLELGERNAQANNTQHMHFINAAAGDSDGEHISFKPQEDDRPPVTVPVRTVDGIVDEYDLKRIDIVHMDVQGAELSALHGSERAIKSGKLRFVFVSTHHYLIAGDPLMHEKCLELIRKWGGHVIAEHAIHESFSGDGLIVASFFKEDQNLQIAVSHNRMQDSLFRPYTEDLAVLAQAYEHVRSD